MKYVDEFRDGVLARQLSRAIASAMEPGRTYRLMEFCGGHTHAIHRYGIQDLLPAQVELIHGPGCPVCVLPMARVDHAIELAKRPEVILCTYADMMRVPGSPQDKAAQSLLGAKAAGADVRMVYSSADAVRLARENPNREVVFFAIGFETTTPPTAIAILQAATLGLANFTVFCNHVLTPAAMQAILESDDVHIDGFVGPAHVSTVIGSDAYAFVPQRYHRPVVIAGFEPLDVMQAIYMLVRQLNNGECVVENEFTRAVTPAGNVKACALMQQVFEVRNRFEWRGLGWLPASGLKIRAAYAQFDAEVRFPLVDHAWADNRACECAAVLRGRTKPRDCKLFGTVCTPQTPVGPCMVSSEGACAAHFTYGRFRDVRVTAE